MRDYGKAVNAYDYFNTEDNTRNQSYNYSQSEVGIRHPDGPVGAICRDQGQLDLYAGPSRHILLTDGTVATLAKDWYVKSSTISLFPKDINSFRINGKSIAEKIFTGESKTLTVKPNIDLSNFIIPTKDLTMDTRTGRLLSGYKIMSEVLEPLAFFEDTLVTSVESLRFNLLIEAIGIKI